MQVESQALQAVAQTTHAACTAPRLDIYAAIHKALRLFMSDTLSRLGRADPGDAEDLARTLDQLDELLSELRHHVRNENDFVHTAIEARQPGGATRTGGDHAEHLAEIATLEAEVRALRSAGADRRAALAQCLYRELAAFVAQNLRHMQVEESQNNAALWALYSDAELEALHDRILQSLPPQEMVLVLRWMARALAPQELAALCQDMRSKMPPEPFAAMFEVIREQLDASRRAQLCRALSVAPVPGLVEASGPGLLPA
jgi:hypothetical protein